MAKMADVSQFGNTKKIPSDLYELCLTNIVNYLNKSKCDKDDVRSLPDSVLMDVYYKMLQEKRLCILGAELSELDIFERLLRHPGAQLRLLQCFQAVIEHGSKLSSEVTAAYLTRCEKGAHSPHYLIHFGLRLGSFLNEAGWYADAERVLVQCRDLCQAQPQTVYFKRLTLECCHRLLTTQSSYCCFPAAAETCALTLRLLGLTEDGAPIAVKEVAATAPVDVTTDPNEKHSMQCTCASCRACGVTSCDVTSCDVTSSSLPPTGWSEAGRGGTSLDEWLPPLVTQDSSCTSEAVSGWDALQAATLAALSALSFARCDYSAAYAWSLKALRLLKPYTPPQVTVLVLRAVGKACVVKRQFPPAGAAVRGAVALARAAFGNKHPRYANALLDYGFYLLNIDSINHSVAVYEEALSSLRRVFGRASLHVAGAQEDLAYALYVLEYTSGRFYKAREHAERAIRIIETLVPPEHLLLASAKRVKALILEEIALDAPAPQGITESSLLEESEALHKSALNLSMMAFGEKNVQTAKHYGNLGRLYQSMQKFQDAETMHLKAIAIKEELLGPEDYEVGLSIGHLASLYNYHMNMHNAAEKLYFRSIAINLKLFGERYSGLEYDYRGLVNVFTKLKRHDRAHFYTRLLHHWHELREQSRDEQQPTIGDEQIQPLDELQAHFFSNTD